MKLRLFILSGLCAWIGVSCGGKKENTGQESIRPVRVVKVESLGAMQKMYTGVVQAEEYSKLAFKVSGPLVEMNVDAGQSSLLSILWIIICNWKPIRRLMSPPNCKWNEIRSCWRCRRSLNRIMK